MGKGREIGAALPAADTGHNPGRPEDRRKVPVSIRLDPQVVEHFKAQGASGYQSRINAVLLAYVRSQQRAT